MLRGAEVRVGETGVSHLALGYRAVDGPGQSSTLSCDEVPACLLHYRVADELMEREGHAHGALVIVN